MAASFPLGAEIVELLSCHARYFALDVCIDGQERQVERPFGSAIPLTDNYAANYERLESRLIPQLDGDKPAAVLWLAHTPYAGSIPRRLGVRGLRARVGNIQIGSDDIFADLFQETRFNGWCVGEVHVTDSRIVPNGRRDYFESSPHLRNLENHLGAVAHEIGSRCRRASSHRNRLRNIGTALAQIRRAHDLARSGYLLPGDAANLSASASAQLPQIRKTLDELRLSPSDFGHDDLSLSPEMTGTVEAPVHLALQSLSPDAATVLQSTFGTLANAMPAESAFHVIEAVLDRLAEQTVDAT